MTIAACYVSPEGVVLGADSTASVGDGSMGLHYYNHGQKVFELGDDSTIGMVIWGLGSLGTMSYRTLWAQFADQMKVAPPASVADVMNGWIDHFWQAYSHASQNDPHFARCKALAAKSSFVANVNPPAANSRTKSEEDEFQFLKRSLTAGFCVGGYMPQDRAPGACAVHFDPVSAIKPTLTQIPVGSYSFWGAPNLIQRLISGADDAIKASIVNSPHWNGTLADLNNTLAQHRLGHAIIPIRDAIDFIHACIYSTIKGMKFSFLSQICGGPIELAVITTDRKFRWVRHKEWDAAITDGARS